MVEAEQERGSSADYYFSQPGLSFSGMEDLAVSPLRYWHLHVNPEKPKDKPTREMQIGSGLHCAVLEPIEFSNRYACELDVTEHGSALLRTVEDLRTFLSSVGIKPKGTRKIDLIAQVQSACPQAPIFDVLEARHRDENAGKVIFGADDWERIGGMAKALRNEPAFAKLIETGASELPVFAQDPETAAPLKGKMDWVSPSVTVDVKTFSQQRGKSIDKSVTDAIWYERYHWQAYFYSLLRGLHAGGNSRPAAQRAPEFLFAFVESDEPYEVRIRSLHPKTCGQVNMLWEHARIQVNGLIDLYAECVARYGDDPWRHYRMVEELTDEEFPALAY